jgi:hypothetical protein
MGRQAELASDLQQLSDPEFFAHWAEVRYSLALARVDTLLSTFRSKLAAII